MAKQRQSRYIHALIILLGIMGGYMYNTTFAGDPASVDEDVSLLITSGFEEDTGGIGDGLELFANKSFNLSILDDPTYQSLQIIGEAEVTSGVTGKANIFAPF